jgi:hypothetical protein
LSQPHELKVPQKTARSLKRQNRRLLAGILLGNLAAFLGVVQGKDLLTGLRAVPTEVVRDLLPAGVALLVVGVLNSQLSPMAKARIVFMKWHNPLPGARAFSLYAKRDDRIDVAALIHRFGPLPSIPKEENSLWYKLYRSVENEVQVRESHQQFLIWRDGATIVLLLSAVLVPAAIVLTRQITGAVGLLALFGLQFGLMVQAARVNAERLVSNVLALKSAEEEATP